MTDDDWCCDCDCECEPPYVRRTRKTRTARRHYTAMRRTAGMSLRKWRALRRVIPPYATLVAIIDTDEIIPTTQKPARYALIASYPKDPE